MFKHCIQLHKGIETCSFSASLDLFRVNFTYLRNFLFIYLIGKLPLGFKLNILKWCFFLLFAESNLLSNFRLFVFLLFVDLLFIS